MADRCPGITPSPKPTHKKCPKCGADVEIWTDEKSAKCPKCGTRVRREETG